MRSIVNWNITVLNTASQDDRETSKSRGRCTSKHTDFSREAARRSRALSPLWERGWRAMDLQGPPHPISCFPVINIQHTDCYCLLTLSFHYWPPSAVAPDAWPHTKCDSGRRIQKFSAFIVEDKGEEAALPRNVTSYIFRRKKASFSLRKGESEGASKPCFW